ncbi:hypothetical protein VMCG_05492 [Cytospora schulzeri]|uniref:Uncharacterized protein n=1 Tax=Cytospora schulzeri TaxID=448051 RepID=A0A423WKD2_9PEZI|nr:hypothetical protein VMCG_05492 [Valsa malicola]
MEEALVLSKFDDLVKSGLVFYDDKQEIIEYIEGGLKFHFILTSALAKKPTLQGLPPQAESNPAPRPERDGSDISTAGYELGDIGSSHVLVANKFCFARPHLMLLAANGHRRQYEPLYEDDLEAAWTTLTAIGEGKDYAAFYNCGQDGGCSRLHKHMQLIPMPQDSFATFLETKDSKEPGVPFEWFYRRLDYQATPTTLTTVYTDLLQQATKAGGGRSQHADDMPPGAACPHNMILTKRWMIVIPRRRAGINKEAGANAMGMLGYIATATQKEIDNWVRLGPTETLKELGVPKEM